MKLVYLLTWAHDPFASLRDEHDDVTFVRVSSTQEAADAVHDAHVLVIGARFYEGLVARAVRDAAPAMRWIQSATIGLDSFVAAGVPAGIVLTTAAGLKGRTVAEHAMALLLGDVRRIAAMERCRLAGAWAADEIRPGVRSLEGLTLLSVGYGSIGQEVVRKAGAFDMHTIAVNRTGRGETGADELHPIDDIDKLLPRADAVVLSLPLSPLTKGLIGAAQFALMKPSAVVVNVGRGAVIDQVAMTAVLREGQIGGAALDVFDAEPLCSNDPLWALPNVIISPHVGGTGGPTYARFTALVSQNLSRLKAGEPLINQVSIGATPAPLTDLPSHLGRSG